MIGSKYLSDLVNCAILQQNKLNIIKAPTGSGKTYFALQHVPTLTSDALHKVVYLIDTINGKEQLLQNYNAISDSRGWYNEIAEDGIWFIPDERVVIITYAKFGVLLERESDFYNHFSYIICDELHSLIKFQYYSRRPNYHSVAKVGLENAVKNSAAIVIALSATPNEIKNEFNAPLFEVPFDQTDLIQYSVNQTVSYSNLDNVFPQLEKGSVGLCYMSLITQMKTFENRAKTMGFNALSIWSINNVDHKMTEEQLCVRESILKSYTIPPEYDLLIINSSSETSLKIKSRVDYVIVHSSNEDTQIQVRGRVNSDVQTLYLPTSGIPIISVPKEYLGKQLFNIDKRNLVEKLNVRNHNNRTYGWESIKEFLLDNDYSITEGRKQNLRYAIIEPPNDK